MSKQSWKLTIRQHRKDYTPTPASLTRIWIKIAQSHRQDACRMQRNGRPGDASQERRRALSFYANAFDLAKALGLPPALLSRK